MDWRHNQWVGIGAAVLLVVGIAGMFWYFSTPSAPDLVRAGKSLPAMTMRCESTGDTWTITYGDLDNDEIGREYSGKYEVPCKCQFCDKDDAYMSYYCPTCDKWYHYRQSMEASNFPTCPLGHGI